jgi:ABC-2 type transport system permease protein
MLPAAIFIGGITLVVFGAVPRLTTGLGIGAAVGFYLLEFIGRIVKAPNWVLDLSPYHHVAPAPAMPVAWTAVYVLVAAGVALGIIGLLLFRRRDVLSE